MLIVVLMLLSVAIGALGSVLFVIGKEEKARKDLHSEIREKVIFDSMLDTDTLLERSNKRIESQFRTQQNDESSDPAKEPKDQKG